MAVSNQQIIDFLLANPGMSDADIASNMATYGVSPAQMAAATGASENDIVARVAATLPPNQAVLLGDTWVQTVNQIIGSGEDQQVGALENVITYKTTGGINDAVATGTDVQYYSPAGEYQQTTQTQEVDTSLAPILAMASFIPGVAPFAQGINALMAAKSGNVLGAIAGAAGLGGLTDVANAANFANAAKNKDVLGMVMSGANLGGVENIGDYSVKDIGQTANAIKAAQSEDPNALLNAALGYASNVNNNQPVDDLNDLNNSQLIETYPETNADLTSILAGKLDNSSITAPTDTQSLLDILGDTSSQIISDAPFVAQPTTQQATTPQVTTTTDKPVVPAKTTKVVPPVSDVYPDIRGTAADKSKAPVTTASNTGPYVGYKNAFGMTPQMGDINQVADPRTLAFTKGLLGDESTSKGFSVMHPDIAGIKTAGDVGTYSNVGVQVAPVVGPMAKWFKPSLDTLGSAAAADESLVSLLGKNTYKAPDNAAPFPRLTADDRQMSLLIQDMLGQPKTNQTAGQAWDQLTGGSPLQAYHTLNANPATRASMLDYAGSRGYSEVSPFSVSERTNMFQPAQYIKNTEGAIVPNQTYLQAPKGPIIKASGGLIPSNNMDELLKIING
jgi:hypothetical protein